MARGVIVGGGLAGLACALDLVDRGVDVVVLEAAPRAGGKAGADPDGAGVLRDHGLHIFPGWYVNVREILERIGAAGALVDHHQVAYVERGAFPDGLRVLREPIGLANLFHNTFRGPLPWHQSLLYQYFMLDLAGQPFSRRSWLDRVSETGLLYGRWYRTEAVARFCDYNVLHAASVNADEISAQSWQYVLRYWLKTPSPFFSILDGDLQTRFIAPLVAHLGARGVTVHTGREVVGLDVDAGGRLAGVRWRDGAGGTGVETGDVYVLSTPPEAAARLVDDRVFAHAPELGAVNRLRTEPMTGFHVELSTKIPRLGADFLFLVGTEYALSVIDVTPSAPTTTLSCVVGWFGPLRSLSDAFVRRLLIDELRAYLPFPASSVTRSYLHNNVSAPLFINTVGAWPDRPAPRSSIPNLYLAGDFCKNAIDLATMEGAVVSGRQTAQVALRDLGMIADGPRLPPERPRWLYRALFAATAPLAVIPWLRSRFDGPHT